MAFLSQSSQERARTAAGNCLLRQIEDSDRDGDHCRGRDNCCDLKKEKVKNNYFKLLPPPLLFPQIKADQE